MEPLTDLERMGRLAAEQQDALADHVADLEVEGRRFLAAPTPARWPRARVTWLAAAALAALTCIAIVVMRAEGGPGALTFQVGQPPTPGEADAWLASPPEASLPLGFSDGTSVTLEPRARARVTNVAPSGATILVEDGRVRVSVVKRRGAAWKVSLGPFRVQVTGTRFDAGWDPRSERLFLDMHEGSVLVTGCMFGSGRPITAGETLRASCTDKHVEISAAPVGAATAERTQGVAAETEPPQPTAVAVPEPPTSSGSRPQPDPGASGAARGATAAPAWRELVRAGRHGEALDAAEAAGFSSECATASASDLVALADAARYVGRLDRATEAYETARRRFPRDERAAVAAFALGRIAFDQRHNYADAVRWFRTYLLEQPGGRLARDALGRLLESLERTGDAASARKEAERYLELYPTGPHADFARRLKNPE